MCGKWVPNCALICLGSRVSFDLPLALAPGVFMTGPGCGWSKISRVRAPYDNLDPAVKPLQSPESAVYIMDSLLASDSGHQPGLGRWDSAVAGLFPGISGR